MAECLTQSHRLLPLQCLLRMKHLRWQERLRRARPLPVYRFAKGHVTSQPRHVQRPGEPDFENIQMQVPPRGVRQACGAPDSSCIKHPVTFRPRIHDTHVRLLRRWKQAPFSDHFQARDARGGRPVVFPSDYTGDLITRLQPCAFVDAWSGLLTIQSPNPTPIRCQAHQFIFRR